MNNISELIRKLESIAETNKDEFRYWIDLEIVKTPIGKLIKFTFNAHEQAEDHPFLCGSGPTVEKAVENALKEIPEACEEWGYENPSDSTDNRATSQRTDD